jgi:hypothetical protein
LSSLLTIALLAIMVASILQIVTSVGSFVRPFQRLRPAPAVKHLGPGTTANDLASP